MYDRITDLTKIIFSCEYAPNFRQKKRKVFPSKTLEKYHAKLVSLRKDQALFHEGDPATDYFQVEKGSVKMYSVSREGQEFIQGIFNAGESFGEPALIAKFPYPGSVVAIEETKVWKLPGDYFLQMLKENFDLHLKMDQVLCQRLRYKSMVLSEISSYEPEHRIISLFKYYKSKNAALAQTSDSLYTSAIGRHEWIAC